MRQARRSALLLIFLPLVSSRTGLLHPQTSESREVQSLDGLWRFNVDVHAAGLREGWHMSGLPHGSVPMAVPSSYNDLLENTQLREHVGLVWYERECFVPLTWRDRRVVLFVGSANHHASVWLNGKRIGEHEGGHLPFHLPLENGVVEWGRANRLTIALNNTLTTTTIPPGFVQTNIAGRRVQRLQMDFFNYAGLHRQVLLYSTPNAYLDDILVSCRLEGSTAHLNVFVSGTNTKNLFALLSAGRLHSTLLTHACSFDLSPLRSSRPRRRRR